METASNNDDAPPEGRIELIKLPFLEDYPLYIGLFSHLRNATFLRKQLLEGNQDYEYAFIDANSVFPTPKVMSCL